jgi:hypothetical protein
VRKGECRAHITWRSPGSRVDRLALATGRDGDLAGLGLLGHRDVQGQHPGVIASLDVLGVQVLTEEQLPAEDAARPLTDHHLGVVLRDSGALRLHREHVVLHIDVDGLRAHTGRSKCTGLGIAPMGLAIFLAANLAGKLIARWGLGPVAALGMLVQACGILLFLLADSTSDYLTVLLPALLIHGIGNGLSFPSLNIAAVRDLPEHQQGLASGLITSAVQIGAGSCITI